MEDNIVADAHGNAATSNEDVSDNGNIQDIEAADIVTETVAATKPSTQVKWWGRSLLPRCNGDDDFSTQSMLEGGGQLSNPDTAAVLLKFLLLMIASIGLTRFCVCSVLELECDQGYTLELFLQQDLHKVVLELVFLFFLGRMESQLPIAVDSIAFGITFFVGCLSPSLMNELQFLKVSLSAYSMRCNWTIGTYMFFIGVIAVAVLLIGMHLHYICSVLGRSARMRFLGEVASVLLIFVLPRVMTPAFHAHHWTTSWLIAQFCHFPKLWSRLVQAFFLGTYANGIGVYGRDPVLGCLAAFNYAHSLQCPWHLKCSWPDTTNATLPAFVPPNLDDCSRGDYT